MITTRAYTQASRQKYPETEFNKNRNQLNIYQFFNRGDRGSFSAACRGLYSHLQSITPGNMNTLQDRFTARRVNEQCAHGRVAMNL